MMNPHKITAEFEKALCDYCGSAYAVAVDNCSNALFLALYYELNVKQPYPVEVIGLSAYGEKPVITIPRHTYPSVPCEIIHAGGKVNFVDNVIATLTPTTQEDNKIYGAYRLAPTNVID